ncbi:hypothetical protein [Thalassotalea marina]|uniref:DUF2929 family protein n=1 Tax=Thalassotalea marina TaxID=1673741 RepID=A0A919EPC0_9GAMM|nr:hypothetical protein [Thalassotalea marina]GHG05874.1 hypothetical protein GCM10017161_39270 [Thalassotalea marina]
MKKVLLFALWFAVFAFSFTFIGGLMSGLSNGMLFTNATITISISLVLAFTIALLGVNKQLLPGSAA